MNSCPWNRTGCRKAPLDLQKHNGLAYPRSRSKKRKWMLGCKQLADEPVLQLLVATFAVPGARRRVPTIAWSVVCNAPHQIGEGLAASAAELASARHVLADSCGACLIYFELDPLGLVAAACTAPAPGSPG